MDLRFATIERAFGSASAELPAIDYQAFVAVLAASQAVSATARAAACLKHRPACASDSPLVRALSLAVGSRGDRPAGSFHGAAAVQASATDLKEPFTLAFQPSFKAARYIDGIGQHCSRRPR